VSSLSSPTTWCWAWPSATCVLQATCRSRCSMSSTAPATRGTGLRIANIGARSTPSSTRMALSPWSTPLVLRRFCRVCYRQKFSATPPPKRSRHRQSPRGSTLLAKLGHRHLDQPYHLCSEQHCQVYAGASREDTRTTAAVQATHGQALLIELRRPHRRQRRSLGQLSGSGTARSA
jgi:hypothetical protein